MRHKVRDGPVETRDGPSEGPDLRRNTRDEPEKVWGEPWRTTPLARIASLNGRVHAGAKPISHDVLIWSARRVEQPLWSLRKIVESTAKARRQVLLNWIRSACPFGGPWLGKKAPGSGQEEEWEAWESAAIARGWRASPEDIERMINPFALPGGLERSWLQVAGLVLEMAEMTRTMRSTTCVLEIEANDSINTMAAEAQGKKGTPPARQGLPCADGQPGK